MFLIALKIILCSALLIGIFYLFLEKEKMFSYNRFFLIFALVFSYTIPFLVIRKEIPKPQNLQITFEETVQKISTVPTVSESFDWMNLVWIFYGIISVFFVAKAVLSFIKIKKIKGGKIKYCNCTVLITDENISPFSFLNTIYINRKHWMNHEINPEIFLHEKAHLVQKHSLDLMFLEILKIFSWWNPALYFYKNAITANHEFSADNEVLKHGFEIRKYQNLILHEMISEPKFQLVHSFNFNNTKKRFIMMTFKNSKFETVKKLLSFSALSACFFLFVQKAYAFEKEAVPNKIKDLPEKKFDKENNPEVEIPQKPVQDTIRKNTVKNVEAITKKEEKSDISENKETIPPPMPDFTQAEFPGGLNEFRRKVSFNFNTAVFSGNEGSVKATLYISINEKGEVTKVSVEGNNEAFNNEAKRVIAEITRTENFIPAKSGNENVSTVFQLPMTMSFQK